MCMFLHNYNIINSEWLSFLGASYNKLSPTKKLETRLKDSTPTNSDDTEFKIEVNKPCMSEIT